MLPLRPEIGQWARALAAAVAALLPLACQLSALPRETPEPVVEDAVPPAPATLLRGGRIMTAAGPSLEGSVMIVGGRVEAVGPDIEPYPGAQIIDLEGRWVTPGLIDPHSHLGVYPVPNVPSLADGNEMSGPLKPAVRAEESFWPQDPGLRAAVGGGLTTIHVLPGSANLVGGQGVTLRLRPGLSAATMRFPDAPTSMKMACGENPKRFYGDMKKSAPGTRMAEVAMLRQALEDARAYARKRQPPPQDKDSEPKEDEAGDAQKVDYGQEALARVLAGEILIQNHCYRADEMLLRLDLFDEFGIKPRAFHHAIEAYKIRKQLAQAEVAAVVWADWWGFKLEAFDAVPAGVALLEQAGVRVSLHSDSPRDMQRMNQEAARALAAGRRAGIPVERDRAIRWITANPAWVLGIEDRVGTLEPGKDADVVVWSGDPFSVYTRVDLVFIEGEPIYDRSQPELYPVSDFELGIGGAQ